MFTKGVYFVSGIDTDCGKSRVTGTIARELLRNGKRVITQKLIQTGCDGISEDIVTHREIMGIGITAVDRDRTTCPLVMSHPCSPHLAAVIDGVKIDLDLARRSTHTLSEKYDIVLVEGAGGLMVPIDETYFMADYAIEEHLPLIFVTTPRLGSINHTLLNFEYCKSRGLEIHTLIYNNYGESDPMIVRDTREYLRRALARYMPNARMVELVDDKFVTIP